MTPGNDDTTASCPPSAAAAADLHAAGGPPAAETLRRVAEEVRAAFPRPLRSPELVLIDVDPRHLHAFWTLNAAAVAAAREACGASEVSAPMVLRIYEEASGALGTAFDVDVVGLQGQCYVDIWGDARRYCGELGLLPAGDDFQPLARSAPVELPRAGTATEAGAAAEATAVTAVAPPALPVATAKHVSLPGEPTRHPVALPPTEPGEYLTEAREGAPAAPAGGTAAPKAAAPELPEPVRHPFPLPPTEPGEYDVEIRTGGNAPAIATSAAGVAPPPFVPASELPEPVRHPFPLPPTEPGEYAPEALLGGFLPPDTPVAAEPPPEVPAAAEAPPAAEGQPGGDGPPPAPAGELPGELSGVLPLENVLTLSSWALGRESVEFEINAELHIFGRVRPGTQLHLFGRKVSLRPDGSFSITRPLPNGALILSSLLIESRDEPTD